MRNPNHHCDRCGKPTYVRPSQKLKNKNHYCGMDCYKAVHTYRPKKCENCGKDFKPSHRKLRFCSRNCSNTSNSKKPWGKYEYPGRTANERRLNKLKAVFNFDSCMVVGCSYNITYDIHRLIPGTNGGKYEIGNMFAICPNHHAEEYRGKIKLVKLNDCELEARQILVSCARLESECSIME